MSLPSPVRRASLLAAGALAAATLAVTAPAAHAAPVFIDAETALDVYGEGYTSNNVVGADCAVTSTGGAEPNVPVVENGPAAAAATSVTASFVDNNTPADTGTGASQTSGSGKLTSAGGSVATMDFSSSSATQFTNSAVSDCYRSVGSGVYLSALFTVATPGFLTLEVANTGTSYGEVDLYQVTLAGDASYVEHRGQGLKFNSTSKVYLPVGTYSSEFGGSAFRSSTGTSSGTTTVHAEFSAAGSQTEAVSGKGKKYTTLPTARSCATDSIDASITKKKNKADQIKQVTYFVNDQKTKKVKTPDKKDVVKLTVADGVAADVVAKVQLFPAKKGKPAKTVEVSASYEACS